RRNGGDAHPRLSDPRVPRTEPPDSCHAAPPPPSVEGVVSALRRRTLAMMQARDEMLYAGCAQYYARGRFPYPRELAEALRDELALDGTGGLLDVGCGPGSLALLLAPLFDEVVGVDADAGMVAEAE